MENNTNTNKNTAVPKDDIISFQELFYNCLRNWHWFILSLIVFVGIGITYLLITPPVYTRSASLLIKEDAKGNSLSSGMEQTFSDMGLFKANTNVNNEIISLQSPAVMYEVVKRLHLEMNYQEEGLFHKKTVYGLTLPVNAAFVDVPESCSASFTLSLLGGGKTKITDFVYYQNGEKIKYGKDIKGQINDTLVTPVGKLMITPTPYYNKNLIQQLYVTRSSIHGTVARYKKALAVKLQQKEATIIDLAFTDVCIQRAEDILNTVIGVYNENWVKDKNQIAVSTSMFINERLKVIEQELGHVDENISTFKSENLVPDVQAASNLYMQQSTKTNADIMTLNNQLYMTRYVRGYLTDNTHKDQLLPANSGIENANIESQITQYNTQLLQRNGLVANSSEKNPLVIDLDRALAAMRSAIITSIDNQMEVLNAQIRSLQLSERQTTSRIAANPNQAKYLLSVERQQKVKESLYLFLLQKREENELSQAFTAYNTRVITAPYGSMAPTSPEKMKILFVCFALGLLFPLAYVYLSMIMNTKIRGRKDLENLTIPLIGVIPQYFQKKTGLLKKKKTKQQPIMLVKEGSRDVMNEAFRVLRTNMEFMTAKGQKSNVFMVTSFNPGSGKSFLTMNTAMSLAIKHKKVLVIDGDMRHASASAYIKSEGKGLSDYLNGRVDKLEKVLVHYPELENLHILPVGTIPPNPTELLFEDRFAELIATSRENYDYVLIDCPPVDLVADTQIIEKLADRMVFVLRAGLMERSMLPDLQKIYDEHKYKNMTIVLNGTEGGGRYGYHYGYHYGYYYGSSYGYYANNSK